MITGLIEVKDHWGFASGGDMDAVLSAQVFHSFPLGTERFRFFN